MGSVREHFNGGKTRGTLESLVASDQMFRTNPLAAYAYSWSLMFYLAERETSKLSRYMQLIASRKPFDPYTGAKRRQDFTRVFGNNLGMMEARVDRFIMSLR